MQHATFGGSGRSVSRLCFGAMGLNCAFGRHDEADLVRALHHALDRGVTMIDTARTYGESEAIVGKALRSWSGPRPFLCSKAAPAGLPGAGGWGIPNPIEVAYPAGAVTRSVEESLRAMRVDHIDLLQLHQYWAQYEDEGSWLEELAALRRAGKIGAIGVSLPDHRADLGISIVRSGRIQSVQTIINVFDPLALDSLVPLCQRHGVAVIARCVLDEGGLTGAVDERTAFDELDFRHGYFDHGPRAEYLRRVRALEAYVPAYASSLAGLAIKFALHHPGVTTAAVSMHVPAFANEDLAAIDEAPLPDHVFEEIRRKHRWLHNLYEPKYFPQSTDDVDASGFRSRRAST